MTRTDIPISDWGRVLTDLMANREALGWGDRLALATAVGRQLGQKNRDAEPVALAFVLADDASPEIRKAIAEALVHLDEEDFAKLAAKLSSDTNAFVKTAAERAMKRRRRSAQQTQRTRRNLGAVANRVASFEGTYGAEATKRLRRIADDQFSALVRQTDHDLRQILSPIKTSIASLNRQFDGAPNPQFCRDTLREMDRRMVYLEQFLADLREYAKAGAMDRNRERLAEIVREAHHIARSALRRAGTNPDRVTVLIDVSETMTVCVARHQTVLALVHLIRNGMEAFDDPASRRRKRWVKVEATAEEDAIVVTVSDNACGIHQEDLEDLRAFIPGQNSSKPNGTGFGLPTAARYIEAQGGSLNLDSVQGEGTTLTLTLPVACEDDDA